MTANNLETKLNAIGASGFVTADEVLFLRRSVFADGIVDTSELDCIFQLAERARDGDPEWQQFFSEIVCDYYLREESPEGYLTEQEFESLRARIIRDGNHASRLELSVLVKLLETAIETPLPLNEFVRDQFCKEIAAQGHVAKEDAALIKRFLFARGSDRNIAISKPEAELLFDINDCVDGADNDPLWTEVFVTGLINHLMAHIGYQTISREEAFRRDAWVKDHNVSVGGFFSRMVAGGLSAFFNRDEKPAYTRLNEQRVKDVTDAEKVTTAEVDWLINRMKADRKVGISEKALIAKIRELRGNLPEPLKALIESAA